jgi:hypothetical protein
LCDQYNLGGIKIQVKLINDEMSNQIEEWKRLLDTNATRLERMERSKLTDYINNAITFIKSEGESIEKT